MKILCVTSSAIGHMDFGGQGFIAVANALQKKGCDVGWISYGPQVSRLRAAGCDAEALPAVERLILRPFSPSDDIEQFAGRHQKRVDAMRRLVGEIQAIGPDFIIFDRLLAFGGLIATALNRRFASIGTPGGDWLFEELSAPKGVNVHPVKGGVALYRQYTERLKQDLGWSNGEAASGWLHSPDLNIHFLPHEFYAGAGGAITASVCHHGPRMERTNAKSLGVSFGNQGNTGSLMKALQIAIDRQLSPLPIEVFAGHNSEVFASLSAAYGPSQINLHRWVDFREHFANLRCLIFLGGVGAIWRCLDHSIPMIVAPGHIGDQLENARRIQSLGVGYCLGDDDIKPEKVTVAIRACVDGDSYRNRIEDVRRRKNYSDSIDSVCDRIIKLC